MTFKRLSALTEKINEYREKKPHENVVVFISFDQLSELRTKCLRAMVTTDNNQEYFMGCKLMMVHDEHDYLAVAYELDGIVYNKQEVKT